MKPKLSTFTQRYKFKECRQKSDESVSAYLASLKQISLHCDFGPNLDSNLREQLVWRLYSERMTKKLLGGAKFDLGESHRDLHCFGSDGERHCGHGTRII